MIPSRLVQCKACKSGRPDDDAGCPWCGLLLGSSRAPAPPPAVPGGAVYVDASVRDGVAGLAVVGALGEFTRRVSTSSSTTAELWALEWAFAIAREQRREDLVFRSDCQGVVHSVGGTPAWRLVVEAWGWAVEYVPRELNRRAHSLCVVARKRTLQPVEAGGAR